MYIVVVGAGPVGSAFVGYAVEDGNDVSLIEPDEQLARAVLDEHDIRVFRADIAHAGIYEEADVGRADALVATTGDDTTNLMAMVMAEQYGVHIRVAVVNVAEHRQIFERLRCHVLMDPEMLIARHLYHQVHASTTEGVTTLDNGKQVIETTIVENAFMDGRSMAQGAHEGMLPEELVLVNVQRGERVESLPSRDEPLRAGDSLVLFSPATVRRKALEAFSREKEK